MYLNDLVVEDQEFTIVAENNGTARFLEDQYQFCHNPLSKSLFWRTLRRMESFGLLQLK